MADAETPTHGLAERLDEDATYWRDLHAEQPIRPGYEWMIELADRESAAAAQLRQLDRIKRNTLWNPEDIRGLCELGLVEADWVAAEGSDDAVDAAGTMRSMAAHLRRFADALEADDGA